MINPKKSEHNIDSERKKPKKVILKIVTLKEKELDDGDHPSLQSSLDTQSESEDDSGHLTQALKDLWTRSSLPSPLLDDDLPSMQSFRQRLQQLRQTENDNAGQSLVESDSPQRDISNIDPIGEVSPPR